MDINKKQIEFREALYREHVKLHDKRSYLLVEDYKKILSKTIQPPTYPPESALPCKLDAFNPQQTEDPVLHPIRLDVESDTLKLRDSLVLNLRDKDVDTLATITCNELKMPELFSQLQKYIQEQVVEGVSNPPEVHPDTRIQIQLDITIGSTSLVDQFEWDVSNPEHMIEVFATNLVQDLHLPPEFLVAVSHAIREQVDMYNKTFAEQEKAIQWLPVVNQTTRKDPIGPYVSYLSPAELDRLERDTDRQIRRKRRQTARSRRNNLDNELRTVWSHYDNTALVPCQPQYGAPLHKGIANITNNKADLKAIKAIEKAQAQAREQLLLYQQQQQQQQNGSTGLMKSSSSLGSSHILAGSAILGARANVGGNGLLMPTTFMTGITLLDDIPEQLVRAKDVLQTKYQHASFEFTIKRSSNEVKIRCADCPGKLYSTGPGLTLDNFEIHLNNRLHITNLNNRLAKELEI